MPIDAQGLEIQIGARTLLHPTNFHVTKGDKIGLAAETAQARPHSPASSPETCSPPRAPFVSRANSATFRRTPMPLIRNRRRSTV